MAASRRPRRLAWMLLISAAATSTQAGGDSGSGTSRAAPAAQDGRRRYREATGSESEEQVAALVAAAQRLQATDLAGAAGRLREALRLSRDDNPGLRMMLGQLTFQLGDLAGSRDEFRRGIALMPAPVPAEASFSAAVVTEMLGDHAAAAGLYRQALAVDADHQRAAANLGMALGRQGDLEGARQHLRHARALDPHDSVAASGLEMLRLSAAQAKKARKLGAAPPGSGCVYLPLRPVARAAAAALTVGDFRRRYLEVGIPVVITGLPAARARARAWSVDRIAAECGGAAATLNRRGGGKWAGQAAAANTTLGAFLRGGARAEFKDEYLFDWNVQRSCPSLLDGFEVPKYFAQDLLQRLPAGSHYRDYWPSLFVGGGGTGSEMHVDAWCSHFWMLLVSGSKQWTIFPKQDAAPLHRNFFTATFRLNSTASAAPPPMRQWLWPEPCLCLSRSVSVAVAAYVAVSVAVSRAYFLARSPTHSGRRSLPLCVQRGHTTDQHGHRPSAMGPARTRCA